MGEGVSTVSWQHDGTVFESGRRAAKESLSDVLRLPECVSLGIFSRSWHIDGAKIRYDYLELLLSLSSKGQRALHMNDQHFNFLSGSYLGRDIRCIFIDSKSFEKSHAFVEYFCYVFVPQVITVLL